MESELPVEPVAAPDGGSPSATRVDPSGWTTSKVIALAAAAVFIAVLAVLALGSRVDGEAADSVDVGFLQDMTYHHRQAIQLGLTGADHATDHSVRHFAQEAIVAQQWEIGYMTALLEDWGYSTGSDDRDAMEWMNMRSALEQMPGIIPAEQMDAFADMTGSDSDRAFITLMTEHHRGGIHMAEYAARHANDPRVRGLAARMARVQRAEIAQYDARARELGFSL